jgi:hypothetical protein
MLTTPEARAQWVQDAFQKILDRIEVHRLPSTPLGMLQCWEQSNIIINVLPDTTWVWTIELRSSE